jgi:predicted  nucleic acid-binding Zn-ribbon protein
MSENLDALLKEIKSLVEAKASLEAKKSELTGKANMLQQELGKLLGVDTVDEAAVKTVLASMEEEIGTVTEKIHSMRSKLAEAKNTLS